MNVYINKRDANYSGGMIVVAASSEAEAHEVMCNSKHGEWLQWHYNEAGWRRFFSVEANVESPRVLEEAGYAE